MSGGRQRARGVLVAVGGLVACGKSSLSRALVEHLGALHLEADQARAELASAPAVHEAHWSRAFAPRFEADVYAAMFGRAEAELARGRAVVIDGCFARKRQRVEARALARRCSVPFLFVECRASPETVRARLDERDAEVPVPFWQAVYDDLAVRWEPVDELDADEHAVVACDTSPAHALSAVIERLPPATSWEAPLRPDAVTFDCWNTLLYEQDWPTAHALRVEALRAAAREAGRDVPRDEASRAFDSAWERHMRIWREGVATGAREVALWGLAELGLREPHPALEHLVESFQQASHSGGVRALDGARETLTQLSAAGVRCALVCDTGLTPGRVVRRHLEHLGLLEGLAVQVFSDELGVPKPHPSAFRAALVPLGVDPTRAIHVGDLRRTDVAGARGLCMGSVRIRARHDDTSSLPEADFVVDSHAQLRALLALRSRA